MQPKVSIVIPVYNVKKEYLDICMESVVNQTYENLEVILVNDGSADECKEYCDTLAGKDFRIKVIHKENQGVSEARNTGTAEASGDYIAYVDADDLIAPYAVEHGINEIQKSDADMAIGTVQKIHAVSQFQVKKDQTSYLVDVLHPDRLDELRRVYLNDATSGYVGIEGCGYINRGPYFRIIKQEIAKCNMFPLDFPIGEDVIWNMRLLHDCRKVCIVKEIWYGYMVYQTSAIRKYYGNREELARKYIRRLYDENRECCTRNLKSYGKNMAVEFYCVLNYELMSKKCSISTREKKEAAKEYLKTEPWSLLKRKEIKKSLPFMYRFLIALCSSGLWIEALRLFEFAKGRKSG